MPDWDLFPTVPKTCNGRSGRLCPWNLSVIPEHLEGVDMEVKWFMIAIAVIFGMMFAGMGIDQYSKSQCRIEAIKAGVEADKINQACGVK